MASDISTVKSTIATDSAFSSTRGTQQGSGSGIDFAEIIRKTGSRMDSGLNALSERAGITGVGERSENTPAADERSYDRGDDRNNDSGHRADADDRPDQDTGRDSNDHSERSNDYRIIAPRKPSR